MTTIAAGNHQQIYFDHLDDIVITPGSGGTVKFDCSTPNSAATRPTARTIYSAATISIPAGSTVFLDAVGADATYTTDTGTISYSTDGGLDSTSQAMVAQAGALPIGTYATLALLADVDLTLYPAGVRALVGPDSYGQYSEWYSNGVRWRPRSGILAMKNTAGSVTDATTSEQDAYSVVIPAELIGPNDEVYIEHLWQWPNSATNKTARVKFGGTVIGAVTATTSASGRGNSRIYLRDSKSAQIFSNSTSALGWAEGNGSSSTPVTATIDTTTDVTIVATAQWGTSGAGSNLITLERIAVGIKFAF